MKITTLSPLILQVNQRGDWLFVLVQTDAGITGIGEASHSSNDALAVAFLAQMETMLTGRDPCEIEANRASLLRLARNGGRIAATVASAIEQALWDILGQSLGVPIHAMMGGALRKKLRLYANINRHVKDRSPVSFARAATQAVADGFTAVKLAPFDELVGTVRTRTGLHANWRTGVERVRAVRAAIGDRVELAVDCHSRMEESEALIVGQELADCNLFWYEEPVPDDQTASLRQIAKSVPMPIAAGESLFGIEAFRPFLVERVVDVLMPDVKHDGGLAETKAIAEAARMQQLLIAPHQPAGPVATAATAQVSSTLSNFYILEHAWGEVEWRADLLQPAERIEDGHLILSEESGLGHRLNPEIEDRYRKNVASSRDSSKALVV